MSDDDLITSVLDLATRHKWIAVSSVVIGVLVRLTKRDVTWWPTVDARWRALFAFGLGLGDGVLQRVATGSPWGASLASGIVASLLSISTHDIVIEGIRRGREVGQKKIDPPATGDGEPPAPVRESRRPPAEPVSYSPVEHSPASAPIIPPIGKPPVIKCVALALVVLSTGCFAALPALTQVLTYVSDATQILGAIEAVEKVWFASHPALESQAKIDRAIADAHLALVVALRATEGAKDLSEQERDAAFAEFRQAYQALTGLLRDVGSLHVGSKIGAAPGQLVVPEPIAMRRRP